jgi:hypothetical protein
MGTVRKGHGTGPKNSERKKEIGLRVYIDHCFVCCRLGFTCRIYDCMLCYAELFSEGVDNIGLGHSPGERANVKIADRDRARQSRQRVLCELKTAQTDER